MYQLIYASTVNGELTHENVMAIVKKASEKNEKLGISGLLLFTSKYFLQILEGGRLPLNQTYNHISSDARHKDLCILEYKRIEERRFPSWGMRMLGSHDLAKDVYYKYCENGEFNPYLLSEGKIEKLFLEVLELQRFSSRKAG